MASIVLPHVCPTHRRKNTAEIPLHGGGPFSSVVGGTALRKKQKTSDLKPPGDFARQAWLA